MFIHKAMTVLLGGLLVLASAAALAKPPGGHLNITEVFVDDQSNPTSITIIGEDLLFGPQGPTVTLGEFGNLEIVGTPTDTMIEAALPVFVPAGDFPAGDYLLTVAGGNGQSQNDEYDLTIGVVAPQGEQGKLGPQGEQGKLGPSGAQGEQGKLGPQGEQGKLGPSGAQGEQGKLGPQGEQGKLGPQGEQGKLGPQGEQGKLGPQGEQGKLGPPGAQGEQGKIGPPGIGFQGEPGEQGEQGKIGPQGEQGKIGPQGPVGGTGNNEFFDQPPVNNMQPYGVVNYIIALQGTFPSRNQSEPFLAEIVMFAGNFAPRGWAFCDGQLLAISQNSALYSLLGTNYGGDGRTTFGLPDLRGRAPLHAGNGPGLTQRRLGEKGGSETTDQPSHNHGHTQ